MAKKKEKSKFRKKMAHTYRLEVMSDDSMEKHFSLRINQWNAFLILASSGIFLILLTSILIAFTPLKEYIPGYSSSKLKKTASSLVYKADSLEQKLAINEAYINTVKALLIGDIKIEEFQKDSILHPSAIDEINLNASETDSIFRQEVAQKDRFSIFEKATKKTEIVFFSPIEGQISDAYNSKTKHFAIDIATVKGTPVKAVADGTIIFSGFTADTGYVLLIEHAQGFLSAYKHNESLFKNQGDLVESGEVIATAGSTGTLTTGSHLHFELWSDGYPVNPIHFIDFEY